MPNGCLKYSPAVTKAWTGAVRLPHKEGLELVWYGATAKAYSASFGKWRKVTDVYAELYGAGGKANTGRVSIAMRQLAEAGFMIAVKDPTSKNHLYTSTLEPLYAEASGHKVEFNNAERELLESFLGCAASKQPPNPVASLVTFDKGFFTPPLAQTRDALHSVLTLAFTYLFFKHLEGIKLQSYLDALDRAIGKASPRQAAIPHAFSQAAGKLAVEARSGFEAGMDFDQITMFKLAEYLNPPAAYNELVELSRGTM